MDQIWPPLCVADALRLVWPQGTVKRVALASDRPMDTAKKWVLGQSRGDWDVLVKMMAASDEMEAQVLALVRAERERSEDAAASGARRGVGAAQAADGSTVDRRDGQPGACAAAGTAPPPAVTTRR